jgi:hypothetical protein
MLNKYTWLCKEAGHSVCYGAIATWPTRPTTVSIPEITWKCPFSVNFFTRVRTLCKWNCCLCTRKDTCALRSINGLKLASSCYITPSHCQLLHLETALWCPISDKSLTESPIFPQAFTILANSNQLHDAQSFRRRQMMFKGSLQCLHQPANGQ